MANEGANEETEKIVEVLSRKSIEQRPQIINKRERLGDIEVDLMMGKNHKGSLLVMTDRASLFTRIRKMHSKNADQMAEAIVEDTLSG